MLMPTPCFQCFWLTLLMASFFAAPASAADKPISFVNDVSPVITKAGCNMGICHAKAGGGQRGFQLSLLGFEPRDDYESIVNEGKGRRLFPPEAARSLILRKASGDTPHGGGVRLQKDSESYRLLKRWIEQGAPWGSDSEPKLVAVEVQPSSDVIPMKGSKQLKAIAKYDDGSVRDVTSLALYESNTEAMVHATDGGLVEVQDIPGKIAVMVRYQGKVSVFTAAVPLGATVEKLPPAKNFVDKHSFANFKQIGIPPSDVCDDSTFLRRVTLDIAGRLPTVEETNAFLANTDADKRDQTIDALLRSPQYADYFASKWTPLLKNRRDVKSDITANFAFHAWIRDSLLANVPYDQIVRELLAATGTVVGNPPVAWYKRVKDPKEQLEDIAQLFLGVRMQCAQCHHHPFERWSQDDYYSFAAFFSQIGRKPTGIQGEDMIFHKRGVATARNVKTGVALRPAALGSDVGEISADDDPRLRLADWMSSKDNPFFAKALVNRYWKHFFKRGLIEPEDDIRDTNPPTNPELLAALEKHFIDSGFDLKSLIRVMVRSNTYQLSALSNKHNANDRQNYSHFYPRRLQAEVLLDAINDLTGATTSFANLPAGTRAIALPDNSYNKSSTFLQFFGRPNSQSVCECERVQSSSLAQRLHMINSNEIKTKLATSGGRAQTLASSKAPLEERITEIYLVAFSRKPRSEELTTAMDYIKEPILDAGGKPIAESTATQQNFQDLIWALMNTKEFLFNH
ncbi:MAG: S-layer protein [Planctomycetaceae bacterium]|nr:S-layer protein [Planctomycetaceae bacterium]